MAEHEQGQPDVDQFLLEQIDTVPHLEALLLLWNSRPREWLVEEMASSLYLAPEAAKSILDDLARRGLISAITGASESFRYDPGPERDQIIEATDAAYRRELIRITRLIHSKPSAAIRAFARAFRIKKERE
jgi:DNA-binding MarR family transcriptional regulator